MDQANRAKPGAKITVWMEKRLKIFWTTLRFSGFKCCAGYLVWFFSDQTTSSSLEEYCNYTTSMSTISEFINFGFCWNMKNGFSRGNEILLNDIFSKNKKNHIMWRKWFWMKMMISPSIIKSAWAPVLLICYFLNKEAQKSSCENGFLLLLLSR